jgi:hypothetical protein
MGELYDEVDGAAPTRVSFRDKVQILDPVIIFRAHVKPKDAPFETPPVCPPPAHLALRGADPSWTPPRRRR